MNLYSLRVPAEVITAAAGSEPGLGNLVQSEADRLDYALYMERGEGSVRIVAIDELPITTPSVVLKLDVEGWEGEVLKGARRTLEDHDFVVTVEANGAVYQRTKTDPIEYLQLIPDLHQCKVIVAEEPDRPLDATRSFIQQFPGTMSATRNIVIASRQRQRAH